MLSHTDHQLLEKAQTNVSVILDNDADATLFITMLVKIADSCSNNITVQQYVFTRIEEVLGLGIDYSGIDAESYGVKHAGKFTNDGQNLIDGPFLKALNNSDLYLQKSASLGLACLYTSRDGSIAALVDWINLKLLSSDNGVFEMALPALTMLCRREAARDIFVSKGGLGNIVSIIKRLGANGNAQHIYELTFILWTISLNVDKYTSLFLSSGTVPALVDLIAAAPSRKVVRMSVSTLSNIASGSNDDILAEMLTAGLDKLLCNMIAAHAHSQAGDPEVENDVKTLNETLIHNYRELSTFDRWTSEVQSGALRWGIVHTEKFWKENNKFLEKDDFKHLKSIISLLKSSDPTIVRIALHDLGEFTRFYPNGRVVVSHLGGKEIALSLLSSENTDIQSEALQCVSKIMVTNWEFMR